MKRLLGVLVALAALGGAALAVRTVEGTRARSARIAAEQSALTARQKVTDALRLHVRSLEIRASAAAAVPQLAAQLDLLRQHRLEGEVAQTLRDFFDGEATWEPFRREFKVTALSVEGDRIALVRESKDAGKDTGKDIAKDFNPSALVREARERGLTSGTVMARGWPYAAAAARLVVPSLPQPVVLVLARPFDDATVRELAEPAGGAVVLSDGKAILASSGSAPEIDRLTRRVLGAAPGGVTIAPDGSWAAAAATAGPGAWLWVHATPTNSGLEASTKTTKMTIWGAGIVAAALALVMGLRRSPGPAPGTAPSLPAVTAAGVGPAIGTGRTGAAGTGAHEVSAFGSTQASGLTPSGTAARTFGRYLLLERLGEGGMSQVYTAVTFGAEGFRRKFVVKRLRPELMNDPAVVAQFIDEANLASSLVHSNIVPVFDFGKVGDEYFLATEYILGRDLSRVVRRMYEINGAPPPVGLVLYCAHETLKALEHAHTKRGETDEPLGIVHRDVSPTNVLISARGEVKLFDFGIVKAEGRVTKTQHGVVKGNVSFMSPEQARGTEVDARADLFSLGLVIYYCLTGEPLYAGGTTYEMLLKAAAGPGPDELARIAALPAPAAAIVTRALEVDPARRYQSAGSFAAGIAPFIRSSGKELSDLMDRLFADEFREEERRFAAPLPSAASAGAGGREAPPRTGTRES